VRRAWLIFAGLGGLCSVAAGAIAAHTENGGAELLRTGALYGMLHAAALLALAAMPASAAPVLAAGYGFAVGIVLFSGSLFAVALTGLHWLVWVTPFGGVAFMLGWAALILAGWRRR